MAHRMYAVVHLFCCVTDLQNAIVDAWKSIDFHYIQAPYHSIPGRLLHVVKKRQKSLSFKSCSTIIFLCDTYFVCAIFLRLIFQNAVLVLCIITS